MSYDTLAPLQIEALKYVREVSKPSESELFHFIEKAIKAYNGSPPHPALRSPGQGVTRIAERAGTPGLSGPDS